MTSDGSVTFAYDIENRLLSASGGKTAALVYDPLGRLFQTSGGAVGVTQFLYDGDALVAEYDGSGNLLRRYVHGPGVDEPLLWYEGAGLSARRGLAADHQGSIVAVADASGNMIVVNAYDPYGIPGATNQGRFQYTGQILIPEIGFYHYKARIYSPTMGRFLQTDPIGYEDQINLYAYVGNDPVNARDPDGKQSEWTMDRRYIYPHLSEAQREGLKREHRKIGESAAEGADLGASLTPLGRGGVSGASWLSRAAAPVVKLMQRAEHFKPVASGVRALTQRAAAVQSGLGRLAAGEGRVIAGAGSKDAFRGAEAAAQKYGGNAADYAKVSVSEVTKAGDRVSVHAVRNVSTGEVFERKVIYGR